MKSICYPLVAAALLLAPAAQAQTATERPLVASPAVGETIDRAEKSKFGLFPFYSADEFVEATFFRALSPDSLITLRTRLADGRSMARPYTQMEFLAVRGTIERRLKQLGEKAPAAAPLAGGTAATPLSATDYPFVLGQKYRIETKDGGTFNGQLTSMSLTSVELTGKDDAKISVPRSSVARVVPANGGTAATAIKYGKPTYFDIGNGTRLFNAPTGRSLRKGEGSVLSTYVFLVGAEYGFTDNFSIGATISLVPYVPLSEQVFVIAPKFTIPIGSKLNFGAGVIYANVPFNNSDSGGAGLAYGALTYGTATDNVTVNIGYGFASGEVGKTPVFQLGGQKRLTRRLSLVTENYLVADKDAGMGGLYGVKIHGRRISVGVAAGYFYQFNYNDGNGHYDPTLGMYVYDDDSGRFQSSYVVPVYVDFAFRFGGKK